MGGSSTSRRVGAIAGLVLIVVSVGILVVSVLANPWFSLHRHSISDLGRSSARLNIVYDGGLVAVGTLFLVVLAQVYQEREGWRYRLGLGLFGLTGTGLLAIGFLSNGVTLPDPYAIAFALSGGIGVALLGVATLDRDPAYTRAFLAVVAGGVALAIGAILAYEGLAVAELVAIAGYLGTIGVFTARLLRDPG